MRPVALDAEALEFLALNIQPMLRVGAAFLPERNHRRGVGEVRLLLVLGAVILFLDLPFDRQAVAVPARHVIAVVAEHLLAARHHVFENFIERVADVDVAVGVWRAVVQDEFLAALGGGAQLLVEIALLPALEDFRLALRQPGAHREIRLRQEQRLGIIALWLNGFGHGALSSRRIRRRKGAMFCHPAGLATLARDDRRIKSPPTAETPCRPA